MSTTQRRLLRFGLSLICLVVIGLGICRSSGTGVMAGHYLRGSNGAHIMVTDKGAPYILDDRSDRALFDHLSDGDRIMVVYGANPPSMYPTRTSAYWCVKLGFGTMQDFPADILADLAGLGWLTSAL